VEAGTQRLQAGLPAVCVGGRTVKTGEQFSECFDRELWGSRLSSPCRLRHRPFFRSGAIESALLLPDVIGAEAVIIRVRQAFA